MRGDRRYHPGPQRLHGKHLPTRLLVAHRHQRSAHRCDSDAGPPVPGCGHRQRRQLRRCDLKRLRQSHELLEAASASTHHSIVARTVMVVRTMGTTSAHRAHRGSGSATMRSIQSHHAASQRLLITSVPSVRNGARSLVARSTHHESGSLWSPCSTLSEVISWKTVHLGSGQLPIGSTVHRTSPHSQQCS